MAYDTLRERSRAVFLTDLVLTESPLSFPELAFAWLALNGYTQPTLLERLSAYALFEGVSITVAEANIGLL